MNEDFEMKRIALTSTFVAIALGFYQTVAVAEVQLDCGGEGQAPCTVDPCDTQDCSDPGGPIEEKSAPAPSNDFDPAHRVPSKRDSKK